MKEIIREHYNSTAHLLIVLLRNPVIRGWASYHRHVVSKRIFARVDAMIFRTLSGSGREPSIRVNRTDGSNANTSSGWGRGIGGSPVSRQTRNRNLQHLRLFHAAAAVRIVRHVLVKSEVNPYDPRWAKYLEQRSSRRSTLSASTPWAFGSA